MSKKRIINYKPSKNVSGILLMLLHAIAISIVYVAGKQLTQSLSSFQVTFLYKSTIFIAVLPWCCMGGLKKNIKTKKLVMHAARGAFSTMASVCFFFALAEIPILDVTAISYLEAIVLLFIGFLYFKEDVTPAKIVLSISVAIGVLFITKPGFEKFNNSYIFIFLALVFWAGNNLTIKVLGKTEHTKAQLFYGMMFSSMFSFPLAIQEWKPLTLDDVKYVFALAPCHLIHVVAFFKALKYADMSTVMPFDYTRLIFTGLLGYLYLQEVPDQYSLFGYILIIMGGLYFIQYEARKKGLSRSRSVV